MEEKFTDKELGTVVIRRNIRSKRLIVRYKEDYLLVTAPYSYSMIKIKKFLEEIKSEILALKRNPVFIFDNNTEFQTITFKLNIKKHSLHNYYAVLKDGMLNIYCPEACNFEQKEVQTKIRNYVEAALRAEAKRFLPLKLEELAKKYDFTYLNVKINRSKTRWGSCSSKKNINLSYFCMLLPLHLIEYVLLHELCHTIEMNHGERFWQLLNNVTDNKAKVLAKELKEIKTGL